jgi:hypothetical protein
MCWLLQLSATTVRVTLEWSQDIMADRWRERSPHQGVSGLVPDRTTIPLLSPMSSGE